MLHPERANRELAKQRGRAHTYKLKLCIDCLMEKPIGQFHRKRSAKDGHTPYCRKCGNARSAEWQRKNAERTAPRRLAWRQKSPRNVLSISIRGCLLRRPTENPATLDDLVAIFNKQNGKCALSGVTLTWAQGKILATSMTLDRINPEEGYSANNIRLLAHAVNSFRGRMSDSEMLSMARAIVTHTDKPAFPVHAYLSLAG